MALTRDAKGGSIPPLLTVAVPKPGLRGQIVTLLFVGSNPIGHSMTKEQIDAAIKRANQVLALTAEKSQPYSADSGGAAISEEWSLVMNLAYDVITLAKALKK